MMMTTKRSRRTTWTTMTIERNNKIMVGLKMGHHPQVCCFSMKVSKKHDADEVLWIFGVPYFQTKHDKSVSILFRTFVGCTINFG